MVEDIQPERRGGYWVRSVGLEQVSPLAESVLSHPDAFRHVIEVSTDQLFEDCQIELARLRELGVPAVQADYTLYELEDAGETSLHVLVATEYIDGTALSDVVELPPQVATAVDGIIGGLQEYASEHADQDSERPMLTGVYDAGQMMLTVGNEVVVVDVKPSATYPDTTFYVHDAAQAVTAIQNLLVWRYARAGEDMPDEVADTFDDWRRDILERLELRGTNTLHGVSEATNATLQDAFHTGATVELDINESLRWIHGQ